MNPNETRRLFHGDELDPTVRAVLEEMVSQSPDDSQLQAVIGRLHNVSASVASVGEAKTVSRLRYPAVLTAASFMLCVLWLGAQTETWAQFAIDFQQSSTMEPSRAIAEMPDRGPVDSGRPIGPMLRFVLMLHVFGLLAGLAGMLVAWICGIRQWFVTTWRREADRCRIFSWGQRTHLAALVTYGTGLAFGCIWSQANWGIPWRWDPQEGLPLVTLGIGTLWYASSWGSAIGNSLNQVTRETFVASLAFWLIALLYSLSVIYSAQQNAQLHFDGFPSPVPTIISCLLMANLLILLAPCLWAKSRQFIARE